ncbi:MAG: hypothetical protein JO258_15200 [Alphaproteobacteria bacterium]|nr:hypothetical protein [Alphaproteobacteria bacterium]
MGSSRRVAESEAAATVRISWRDVLALLFLVAWCVVGAVKTLHDIAEYRAQQAAIAAFETRYAAMTAVPNEGGAVAAAPAPYDPALGRWLIGEAVGYVLTLVVVAVGSYQAGRRRAVVQVKWVPSTSPAAARGDPRWAPQSSNLAAERLSVVVWNDRVVQLEKERA